MSRGGHQPAFLAPALAYARRAGSPPSVARSLQVHEEAGPPPPYCGVARARPPVAGHVLPPPAARLRRAAARRARAFAGRAALFRAEAASVPPGAAAGFLPAWRAAGGPPAARPALGRFLRSLCIIGRKEAKNGDH